MPRLPSEFDVPLDLNHVQLRMNRLYFTLLTCCALACQAQVDRVANTSLALPLKPATFGYSLENAFPSLPVEMPIMVATPPGETNRLFIVERWGRITIATNLAEPSRTVFLDISSRITHGCEEGLLGLAFHPGFATNGYFFVFYSLNTTTELGTGLHERVARFKVSDSDPNQTDPDSELPLITQYDHACNHNGGNLAFGPDGYLYIGVGDEGGQNDQFLNSQRIDRNFFSGILRIDVDKLPSNLPPNPHSALMGQTNYFVPADNPFVGATQYNNIAFDPTTLRSEFWAVGLRNPWRFSFDPLTGVCYAGDVGGDKREEINVIVKGGNYGWLWIEGTLRGPNPNRQAPPSFASIPPIVEYNHGMATNRGNSVTGGLVYRGNRLAQLAGRYLFADYVSGNVWALTPDGTNTVPFERLLGNAGGIVSFGVDPRNGDPLLINMAGGSIWRLTYATNTQSGDSLPPTLADTGAFSDLPTLKPAPGLVAYDVNVPLWSDNAGKGRWFSIPRLEKIASTPEGRWNFPTGSVWVKHFDLQLTNGVAASARRLETRLLVQGSEGFYGMTYRWGDSMTNATLVPEEGMDEAFLIHDGDTVRTQVWHYPSRSECMICHTPVSGYVLGFTPAQLNRDLEYNGHSANQLETLSRAGYFATPITNASTLPALAGLTNTQFSVEKRVRSWLEANCVQCHQPGGTPLSTWDARSSTSTAQAGLVNGPLQNNLGDSQNRVLAVGDPAHSALLFRISQNGPRRMPPLAATLFDTNAVELVRQWIDQGLKTGN